MLSADLLQMGLSLGSSLLVADFDVEVVFIPARQLRGRGLHGLGNFVDVPGVNVQPWNFFNAQG